MILWLYNPGAESLVIWAVTALVVALASRGASKHDV
jgi:hypothetical protein